MSFFFSLCIILLIGLGHLGHSQSNVSRSVLGQGEFYQLSVHEPGIYKVDFEFLERMGIASDSFDPALIQIFFPENHLRKSAHP